MSVILFIVPVDESDRSWHIYCDQCSMVVKQIRFFCAYCEHATSGEDYKSFDLCLRYLYIPYFSCFTNDFPWNHEHPRSNFARQCVVREDQIEDMVVSGELVKKYQRDLFDYEYYERQKDSLPVTNLLENNQGYSYLEAFKRRRRCIFCNDDEETETVGNFIGDFPFVMRRELIDGIYKVAEVFWAHENCARFSPEVHATSDKRWFNVTIAARRGRKLVKYFVANRREMC